ncbi:uncharacterized protein TNCV_4290881 [Trichonephila clavipes]|nr:uncharacterized protein TNCV_4290881 [Trichonephila clavipes]
MSVPYVCCTKRFENQYAGEIGSGLTHYIGINFHNGNGIGGIFPGLLRASLYFLVKGGKSIVMEVLMTGSCVASKLLSGENFKEAVKARSRETGKKLTQKANDRVKSMLGKGQHKRKHGQPVPHNPLELNFSEDEYIRAYQTLFVGTDRLGRDRETQVLFLQEVQRLNWESQHLQNKHQASLCNEMHSERCKQGCVCGAMMKYAVEKAVQKNQNTRDIPVEDDGIWQKRGYSSMNGVVTVRVWTQKSGRMEVNKALSIFQRSVQRYDVHYMKYLGDWDTKAFDNIVKNKLCGDNCMIMKLECKIPVLKRMGSRSRRFKAKTRDKPQTLDHLEDNIRRVIADIRPQMLEKVIENWTSRLDYIRASRGNPMPEIIFKI